MDETERQLRGAVREFAFSRLGALLGFLAEDGVSPSEQRERAETLVRALSSADLEESIRRDGRRRAVELALDREPPRVTFSREMLSEIDGDRFLGVLAGPAERALGLSRATIEIVLALDHGEELRRLTRLAGREADVEVVSTSEIPAVVRARCDFLEERVADIVRAASDRHLPPETEQAEVSRLGSEDSVGWGEWEEVRNVDRIGRLVSRVSEVDGPALPEPDKLVELCWDSLDLSAQSFIRHAARELRDTSADLDRLLPALADVVSATEADVPDAASEWSDLAPVAEAWSMLFRTEQRFLSWSTVGRPTPELSVFEPPLESLHLNEPESLPWELPLLCWSVREQNALRDLLDGFCQTMEKELDDRPELPDRIERATDALELEPLEQPVDVHVADFDEEVSSEKRYRSERARRAADRNLRHQFDMLDDRTQQQALMRLRGAFDGFFQLSKPVWERRFQAWEELDGLDAFELLTREIRNVIGTAASIDPFAAPDELELRPAPTFAFSVAFEESSRVAKCRLPLIALEVAFDAAPAKIRLVEVPDDPEQPCRWLGDRELTLRNFVDRSTGDLLASIEDDTLGLVFERPSA